MKPIKQIVVVLLALLMLIPLCVSAGAEEIPEKRSYGVDLSVWNVGGSKVMDYSVIDFAKAKADGCDFAILRIGFEGSKTREDTLDLAFLEYYNKAREAGMKLGVYFYALGTTYAEAAGDAEWVISVIEENDMYFEYPIYYDVEDGAHYALNAQQLTSLCLGWCETLEAAGYYGGVYGRSSILDKLSDDFKSRYGLWLRYIKSDSATAAQYDPETVDVSDQCGMWQYTMFQKFDGIDNSELDGNFCYIDYAAFMESNGFNNCGAETTENLARGKKFFVGGTVENNVDLTDGIASENTDAASWTSFNGNSALVVDLGGKYDISKVQAHVQAADKELFGEIRLSVSDDGTAFTAVANNVLSVSDAWAVIEGNATARYIKLEMLGENSKIMMNEIEVFGKLHGETVNLALNKTYEAPALIRGYGANLTDGVASDVFIPASEDWLGMFWNPGANDQNCPEGFGTVVIDLEDVYALSEIAVNVGSDGAVSKLDAIKAYFSLDGDTYSEAVSLLPESDSDVYRASAELVGDIGRYVKLEFMLDTSANNWGAINEIEVYGVPETVDSGNDINVEVPAMANADDAEGNGLISGITVAIAVIFVVVIGALVAFVFFKKRSDNK